jgi:uncharacterized repeat protein (TIGR02543 family)
MKSTRTLLRWRLLVVVALVLASGMMEGAPVLAQTGTASSTATPSNGTPTVGQQITVTININVSGVNAPDNNLGSFTGTLDWNTAVLSYTTNSGIQAGFSGVVNAGSAGSGHIAFNGANPSGATGSINVLTITFNVVGAGTSALNLEYSVMAAASTFNNLLPILTVNDGSVVASGGGGTTTRTATPTQTRTPTPTATLGGACPGAVSSASPSNGTPTVGQQVVVTINVNMAGVAAPNNNLGSFTGTLDWNTAVLSYTTNSGILAGYSGVVNTGSAGSGHITFNGANASGPTGSINVLTITFNVVGAGTSTLNLEYSAMAAAGTFCDLLPGTTVNDGSVVASGGGATPTQTRTPTRTPTRTLTPVPGACPGAVAAASPSNAGPTVGQQVVVSININMAGVAAPNNYLGSFTGSLAWNTAVLAYNTNSGILAGFTGAVNTANVGSGQITFNGANASGATGNTVVFQITFDVVGPGTSALNLEYSAMAAANTFCDLLPGATVNDGSVVATGTVTCYALTLTHTGTGSNPVANPTNSTGCPSGQYLLGAVIGLTASPGTGWTVGSWSGTNNDSSTSTTNQVTMPAAAHTSGVNYVSAAGQYILTTFMDPSGAGWMTPWEGEHAFDPGELIPVTAHPYAGFKFDHWSGACTGSGSCAVLMDADKEVTAHFAPLTYDLTIAADPAEGGTTDPVVGVHTYLEGTVVDVTATPATGYTFTSWSGACTGSGSCSVTMDSDKSVTAHFAQIIHNLTVAVDPLGGGTTNPAVGVHAYADGTVVDITATPATGYTFSSWSGACSGSGACSVTMDADKEVTAHFAQTTHNLTVAVSPAGGGTTSPAVGVHVYPHGTVVDVTATPASGYTFTSWSGACSGSGSCSVTMDADKTVTANFSQLTHTLTVAVSPAGGGTTSPAVGAHVYPHGTVVGVTATPAAGYTFASWSGACTGSGSCSVTMDADKTVTANFASLAPDLSLAKQDGGQPADPGGTIIYVLTYHNTGTDATGVVLTETVPAYSAFNAASTSGWVCVPDGSAGSVCTFDVGAVAMGGVGSVSFAVTVNAEVPAGVTAISNTASIADDGSHGPDPTPGNNTASVQTAITGRMFRLYLPLLVNAQ